MAAKYLAGKVALVTGSSQGIGFGIIRQLASHGATVIMHGKVPDIELKQKSTQLAEETGVDCGYRNTDLTQPAAIRSMIASIQHEYGSLDILVNNAGIQHVAPVASFPEDKVAPRGRARCCCATRVCTVGRNHCNTLVSTLPRCQGLLTGHAGQRMGYS